MVINQYLIISEGARKYSPSVKLVKTLKGTMPSNSIALKLNIHIPDAIFKKPQLEATIKINESDITKPLINAETIDNIKQVLSQNLGIDMTIQMVEPELQQ